MGSSRPAQSLPELPAGNWANPSNPVLTTVPAQSGGDTWRVIAQAVPVINSATNAQQTVFMVLAVDLGPVGAEIQRLITVELIAGTAIVVVLAIVGIAVVRANLRPLDDIEMTAGEIAKGHLDHRIPERDPRTEIGSLGRSLNIMLSQIEAAFRAQHESEQGRAPVGGTDAPVHRRRQPRAAHPADHDPRLRRVLPSARRGEKRSRSAIQNGRRRLRRRPTATPPAACPPRTSTASCSGSSQRHPGWGCSSRTCCSSHGLTSSGRWTWPRSTCSPSPRTRCKTPGSWPLAGRSTSRSRRAPRSSWRATSRGCGR